MYTGINWRSEVRLSFKKYYGMVRNHLYAIEILNLILNITLRRCRLLELRNNEKFFFAQILIVFRISNCARKVIVHE